MAASSGNESELDSHCVRSSVLDSLPVQKNILFAGSGRCLPCHGPDPLGVANVDLQGNDINVVDSWRASMMANSAKDPFWRAKVSHEVHAHPEHQGLIEDKCTSCHTPLGHFAAHYQKLGPYAFESILEDSLALDGVSCVSCHQQSPQGIGVQHSGNITFESDSIAYGPYISPLASPMVQFSGYTPVHAEHTADAGLCGGCHTLITQTVDPEGNITGDTFVEQATYHEWLNSDYEGSVTCQGCHMPAITKGQVFIATGYDTEPRSPFFLHEFSGANSFMLELMKNNIDTLGLWASASAFEEAMELTLDQLQQESVQLSLDLVDRDDQHCEVTVELTNLAGHKLPSGYPSRRMFVQLEVVNEEGEAIFHSGEWDDEFRLNGEDLPFEPHHDVITDDLNVQIYEMVMGDVNGDFTTILDEGYEQLKDNRLLPTGFSDGHPAYDTTMVVGLALADANFGFNDVSNKDWVTYDVPLDGYLGNLNVYARAYYQSLPQRWMDEIFEVSTPRIDFFEELYYEADRTPVLMKADDLFVGSFVGLEEVQEQVPSVWPKLGNGEIRITMPSAGSFILLDSAGRLLMQKDLPSGSFESMLETEPGVHFVVLEKDGQRHVERIIIL